MPEGAPHIAKGVGSLPRRIAASFPRAKVQKGLPHRAAATQVARNLHRAEQATVEQAALECVSIIPDGEAGLRLLDVLEHVAAETGAQAEPVAPAVAHSSRAPAAVRRSLL